MMIDVSDCVEIYGMSTGTMGCMLVFKTETIVFLNLLEHKRRQVPKDEHILSYPFRR